MNTADDTKVKIAALSTCRCCNCFSKLPGYNVHGEGWHWVTENVGPFCDGCWAEIAPKLKR